MSKRRNITDSETFGTTNNMTLINSVWRTNTYKNRGSSVDTLKCQNNEFRKQQLAEIESFHFEKDDVNISKDVLSRAILLPENQSMIIEDPKLVKEYPKIDQYLFKNPFVKKKKKKGKKGKKGKKKKKW